MKKEAQPSLCKESFLKAQKKTELGYLGTTRTTGSSGNAGNNQLRVGQLKKACSWAQGTKKDMSH